MSRADMLIHFSVNKTFSRQLLMPPNKNSNNSKHTPKHKKINKYGKSAPTFFGQHKLCQSMSRQQQSADNRNRQQQQLRQSRNIIVVDLQNGSGRISIFPTNFYRASPRKLRPIN